MSEPTKITTGEALDIMSRQAVELDRLRALGDALADTVTGYAKDPCIATSHDVIDARDAWRAAR